MSNTSKLGNLSQAEKSVKDKQGPNEEKPANSPDEKDSKQEESDKQSENGNS